MRLPEFESARLFLPEGFLPVYFSADSILGIGVDICDVSRIAEAINRHHFYLAQVYTPEEIIYCDSASGILRAERYAARFAAKEAVGKAIGGMPHRFLDAYITKEKDGQPRVELRGEAKEYADRLGVGNIFLSMSHIRTTAIAFAIAVRKPAVIDFLQS